jgi:peptidase E
LPNCEPRFSVSLVKSTTTIHLTGGGPGAFLALRRHFKSALQPIESKRPLVAYVGAASDDNAGFFTMIKTAVCAGATQVRMRQAKSASPRASASDARALLEECDLVFVSGGDVEHGMNVLREKDLAKPLKKLAESGKPMFGISAGSLMLAKEWVRFPDDDPAKAEIFPCLGIAPLHADAHDEADNWNELRVLVDLLRRRGDDAPLGYGLTRKGGLRIALGSGGAKIEPIGTPIPRIGVRKNKVVDLAPLPL